MLLHRHMITVRKATLKPRPVSASGYEYLFHQQKRSVTWQETAGGVLWISWVGTLGAALFTHSEAAPPCWIGIPSHQRDVWIRPSTAFPLLLASHVVLVSLGLRGQPAHLLLVLSGASDSLPRDQDPSELSGNPPLQTCWQCQAQQQACALKHLSRAQDFATLYPYGDPNAITYDNVSPPGREGGREGQVLS